MLKRSIIVFSLLFRCVVDVTMVLKITVQKLAIKTILKAKISALLCYIYVNTSF